MPVPRSPRKRTHSASWTHGHVRLPTVREEDHQQPTDHVRMRQALHARGRSSWGHLRGRSVESQGEAQMHTGFSPPSAMGHSQEERSRNTETEETRHVEEKMEERKKEIQK